MSQNVTASKGSSTQGIGMGKKLYEQPKVPNASKGSSTQGIGMGRGMYQTPPATDSFQPSKKPRTSR